MHLNYHMAYAEQKCLELNLRIHHEKFQAVICVVLEQIYANTQSVNEDPVALSVCPVQVTQKFAASAQGGRHH